MQVRETAGRGDRLAEPGGERVDVVDAELHERAAGVALASRAPLLRRQDAGQRERRLCEDDLPERSIRDQLRDPPSRAEPPERVADHQRHARLGARGRHPFGVLDRVGDRLLDEHAQAALGARERDLRVRVVRREDQRRLDLRVLERDAQRRRGAAARALGERAAAIRVAAVARDEPQAGALGRRRDLTRPHPRADQGDADRPPVGGAHARSRYAIQSPTSGRYLYGTLLQTWLPSSNSTHSPSGASSAIRFVSSNGISRSWRPVTTRHGWEIRSATPSSESAAARSRASSGDEDPVWCSIVSRVSDGRLSQFAAKSYGPLMPATARIRGSNAAARGA